MEIKLDVNSEKLTETALRDLLLKGTIEHVLAQLTPERMETFLGATLTQVFDGLLGSGYGSPIKKAVEQHADKIILQLMKSPEVQARIETACNQAVDKFIGGLPEELSKRLVQAASEGIKNRLKIDSR